MVHTDFAVDRKGSSCPGALQYIDYIDFFWGGSGFCLFLFNFLMIKESGIHKVIVL